MGHEDHWRRKPEGRTKSNDPGDIEKCKYWEDRENSQRARSAQQQGGRQKNAFVGLQSLILALANHIRKIIQDVFGMLNQRRNKRPTACNQTS